MKYPRVALSISLGQTLYILRDAVRRMDEVVDRSQRVQPSLRDSHTEQTNLAGQPLGQDGEARYRYAFEAASVSLWEEDFTDVAVFLNRLRSEGIHDFRAHFDRHPSLVEEAVGLVRVRDVNRETLRVFGAGSKEELMGSLARIFTENSLLVFKEELIALAEGRSSLATDAEQRTLAGETRQFMFTITFPAPAFPDPAQPLDRVLVTLVDVTERRRAEQSMREQELRMRLALGATGAATWVIDYTRGAIESFDARACELAGFDPARKHWPAGTFCELLHPEDRALMQAAQEATHAAEGAAAERGPLMEYRIMRADGQVRWLQGAGVVQRDAAGRPLQFIGVSIDITERHHVEQALVEADRRKDQFLAVLAHELRNPLAPIRNGLQILRLRAGGGDSALQSTLSMMDRQTSHLVRLIDDLLDVSRITRGKLDLRRHKLLLTDVLASAVEGSRVLIEARGHELSVNIRRDAGELLVDGDLHRLAQVFSNLLSNSAKYTDTGGRITLVLERENDEAVVRVQDNGIGIPRPALDQVFDLFSQAHEARADGGLGIGLSLVRTLVQMHNGSVTAFSEGPGTGSTFTVRLPIVAARTEAPAAASVPTLPASARQERRRVLVVDDSADAAASLSILLEMEGHELRTAADGEEAIEQASEFCPDIIFMDLGMPRMDGLEAARRIRALDQGQRPVIVALTGWGQQADRQRTMDAGMDYHLVKPVGAEDLRDILRKPRLSNTISRCAQ